MIHSALRDRRLFSRDQQSLEILASVARIAERVGITLSSAGQTLNDLSTSLIPNIMITQAVLQMLTLIWPYKYNLQVCVSMCTQVLLWYPCQQNDDPKKQFHIYDFDPLDSIEMYSKYIYTHGASLFLHDIPFTTVWYRVIWETINHRNTTAVVSALTLSLIENIWRDGKYFNKLGDLQSEHWVKMPVLELNLAGNRYLLSTKYLA